MSAGTFGMMSDAYFVSKGVLLEFLNDFLQLDVQKVEQCATGAIYCQLLDALYPDAVNMKKVDWEVKEDHEFLKNWKIIQQVFRRKNIQKKIPIDRITCGRFQDNLEFLQWFYQFFKDTWCEREYDPVERRQKSKGGATVSFAGNRKGRNNRMKSKLVRNRTNRSARPPPAAKPKPSRSASSSLPSRSSSLKRSKTTMEVESSEEASRELEKAKSQIRDLQRQIVKCKKEYEQLTNIAKDIEKERDFYYGKVLKIDEHMKESKLESDPQMADVMKILYETDDQMEDDDDQLLNELAEGELAPSTSNTVHIPQEVGI